MFYSKKISGLVGVSMNVDEGVETTVSPDDILKPNPKKPKIGYYYRVNMTFHLK